MQCIHVSVYIYIYIESAFQGGDTEGISRGSAAPPTIGQTKLNNLTYDLTYSPWGAQSI